MNRIDFIPAAYHEAVHRRHMLRMRWAGIAVLVAFMGIWFVINRGQISSAQAMMADIAAQQQQLNLHLQRKQGHLQRLALLDARSKFLAHLEQRTAITPIMADIGQRMPSSILLTALYSNESMLDDASPPVEPIKPPAADKIVVTTPKSPGGPTPTAPPKPVVDSQLSLKTLTIEGVARETADILAFNAQLEKSPLLDKVQMSLLGEGEWGGRIVRRFRLTCDLVTQVRSNP